MRADSMSWWKQSEPEYPRGKNKQDSIALKVRQAYQVPIY